MLKTLGVTAGACALLAGAVIAGTAADATTTAAAPSVQAVDADPAALALDAADTGTAGVDAARVQLLCARVPNAVLRTQNLEKRLAADADTQGSLAWLTAKADAAEAAHRTELATVLKNRLAFRTQLAQFLPQRLALLQKAQETVCATGGAATS